MVAGQGQKEAGAETVPVDRGHRMTSKHQDPRKQPPSRRKDLVQETASLVPMGEF